MRISGREKKAAFDPLGKANRKQRKGKSEKRKVATSKGTGGRTVRDEALSSEAGETENLIDTLAEQFAGSFADDEDGELKDMVNGVMKQLLSKEVLYEPLKEISTKYPKWLEENGEKISKEDYERYSRQESIIKQLCLVYESSNSDFEDVLHLMQEIQSCGQPPEDIIHELAPDLQVGPDGLPAAGADPMQMLGGSDKPGCPIQ